MAYCLAAYDQSSSRLDEHIFVSSAYIAVLEVSAALGMAAARDQVSGSALAEKLEAAKALMGDVRTEIHREWLEKIEHLLRRAHEAGGFVTWE